MPIACFPQRGCWSFKLIDAYIHCPTPSERLATKTAYFISSPTFQVLGEVSENFRHLSLLLLVPVSLILVNLNSFV